MQFLFCFSFAECINYLQTAYLDNLRVKIDRQSISNYGPSSSPRRDQSGSIGSESSALGFGSLTSTSTTNDLSGKCRLSGVIFS